MKKIAIILLVLTGCEKPGDIVIEKAQRNLSEYKIDGCVYIGALRGLDSDILTHKGTCPNPIHKDTCVCR